ncbi:hypothetical protein SAMN02910297_00464 [Methanobrevibacter olleyae]|uniref:Uncharacterized protein n=1 Tax=Methanobrevibacter olleyae TaxID=294671 RepID=A0A1I4GIG6_METOL|nr:hypothetical protein [Methanobrevibacter olleyae]SFL29087.1 hypothetical protein SAMN02910297_00464 [Methanobrevibacter olleyae]
MLTIIIEDMDGNIIGKQSYLKDYPTNKSTTKREKIEFDDYFLNELDMALGVLIHDKSEDDFLICFLNENLLNYSNLDLEDVGGAYLFKYMSFLKELNIKDLLFASYDNNETLELKVLQYVEDVLVVSKTYKFFRFKDKLYFKINKSDDLDILNRSNRETIENSELSVGIIQANKWVYGNKTFCKINNVNMDTISQLDLFSKDIISRELITRDELRYILDDILNRKQFFFRDDIKINYNGEIRYITEFIYPISFNNQHAIELIFLDLTEEKNLKENFNALNQKLESILKLAKLSICQIKRGKIYCSSEFFSIFDISPNSLDISERVDRIEDFFNIIEGFIIKADYMELLKEINRQKKKSNKLDLSFRIRTKKLNMKTLNCSFTIYEDNPLRMVAYIQDITNEDSLEKELNHQLDEYGKLYKKSEESKMELEGQLEIRDFILEDFHEKVNRNLNLFIDLLDSYLENNPKRLENYFKIFQKRIEILKDINEISRNLDYWKELEFREFIDNAINCHFKDLFKSTVINLNMSSDIYFRRDEIDLIYLILSEFFINILNIEEASIDTLEINADEDKEFIVLELNAFILNKIDLYDLDFIGFIKKFEKRSLYDIVISGFNKDKKRSFYDMGISGFNEGKKRSFYDIVISGFNEGINMKIIFKNDI